MYEKDPGDEWKRNARFLFCFYFVFILFFFIFAATFEGFLMKLFWSSFKRHFLPLLFTRVLQDELSFK